MILNGWKEIGNYLGRGVRTVQRWEHLGLPIRRPAGRIRSAVCAVPEEIDAWLKGKDNGRMAVQAMAPIEVGQQPKRPKNNTLPAPAPPPLRRTG